jgi:hypothetical protein
VQTQLALCLGSKRTEISTIRAKALVSLYREEEIVSKSKRVDVAITRLKLKDSYATLRTLRALACIGQARISEHVGAVRLLHQADVIRPHNVEN